MLNHTQRWIKMYLRLNTVLMNCSIQYIATYVVTFFCMIWVVLIFSVHDPFHDSTCSLFIRKISPYNTIHALLNALITCKWIIWCNLEGVLERLFSCNIRSYSNTLQCIDFMLMKWWNVWGWVLEGGPRMQSCTHNVGNWFHANDNIPSWKPQQVLSF